MTCWFQSVLAPAKDDVQWPAVGEQVAGFKLVEPLGRGGFSRVFVAEELGYENRKVAVKICRQDTHEARTLATLTHSDWCCSLREANTRNGYDGDLYAADESFNIERCRKTFERTTR